MNNTQRGIAHLIIATLFAAPYTAHPNDFQARPPFSVNEIIAFSKPVPILPIVNIEAPRPPRSERIQHQGRLNGQRIQYESVVGETFIPGEDNKDAAGIMVTISYIRTDVTNRAQRPVIFIFNGGPGASSTPLQGALAPRIASKAKGSPGTYSDNPASALDAADLVFVDPVGTGFSRALPGQAAEQFWTTRNDAQSVRYLMHAWLKANNRQTSPRYIIGESYGTARAGHVAAIGADLNLNGIVLVSSSGAPVGMDLPYVLSFPTIATTAAFHGKGRMAGKNPHQVFEDNASFAQGPYLTALIKGDELPVAERDRVATEVADRLGLSKAFVLEQNLRLGNYPFMLNLLKDKGLRTGQLDARATGALATYATRQPPYDDPSMHLGASGAPNTPTNPASDDVHKKFLATELGYKSDDGYIGLNLKMLFAFRHSVDFSWRPTDAVAALMRQQSQLRMLLIGGLYDITTPFQTAKYNLSHANAPRDRVKTISFASGHEVYDTDNIVAFNQAIRDFVGAGRN